MVCRAHGKEGSMVRVRQRALQKAPQSGAFLVGATCVVPMCGTCGARYGAFKSTWRLMTARRAEPRPQRQRSSYGRPSKVGQRRCNALAPAPERTFRCKENVRLAISSNIRSSSSFRCGRSFGARPVLPGGRTLGAIPPGRFSIRLRIDNDAAIKQPGGWRPGTRPRPIP